MNSFFNRYSSMFANSWILTLLSFFLLISCKDTKLIENKNGQGLVIERFQVIKEKDVEVKHGLYERFDDQGRLIEQSHYVKGKLEGSRKLFENGVLESEETRIADQFHGPYKAYHPNGQLRMEANYIHDVIT
jgi:antitoxin component YwqK of YwqJK toxin-antitoxin module